MSQPLQPSLAVIEAGNAARPRCTDAFIFPAPARCLACQLISAVGIGTPKFAYLFRDEI